MKQKPIRIRMPGEKLSPEEIAAVKKKQAKLDAEQNAPGFLGRRNVVIGVMSTLGVVALCWAVSWWWSIPFSTGSIEGVVTCDGAPLPGGKITFIPDKPGRPSKWAMIGVDGRYHVKNCPTGPCRITVEPYLPSGGAGGPPPKEVAEIKKPGQVAPPVGTYVKLDPVFTKPAESPLAYNVTTGSQTHPITVNKATP